MTSVRTTKTPRGVRVRPIRPWGHVARDPFRFILRALGHAHLASGGTRLRIVPASW